MTQVISNPRQTATPVPQTDDRLVYKYEVDGEPVNLSLKSVQKYLVGDNVTITEQEFVMFASLCKARKLNPFVKDAYLIKYGNQPAQMVVGKDAILKRAVTNPKYNGKESGVIVKRQDGVIEERNGCFYDPETEKLLGGWAKVYRKDWDHPEYMSVSLAEAAQKNRAGELNQNWATKTATMLEKVAKVRALREAFVEDFGGMYDEDEIQTETPVQPQNMQPDPLDNNVIDADFAPNDDEFMEAAAHAVNAREVDINSL